MPGVSGYSLKGEICHHLDPSERYFQEFSVKVPLYLQIHRPNDTSLCWVNLVML